MASAGSSFRVLVVEDEPDIAALVAYHLTREGLRVRTASSATEALGALGMEVPDLVILDRMLPGVSGDEVLRDIRRGSATKDVAVLMLTALREEEQRIEGLELGADDYLPKPFSPRELVLRTQSLLRRNGPSGSSEPAGAVYRAGPLVLDVEASRVMLDEEEIYLTPTEFKLLQALIEEPGKTRSRRTLLERAWDLDSETAARIRTRTVDMHVRRVRRKLGTAGELIETVRGFGYRMSWEVEPN